MINADCWLLKLCISINNRDRQRNELFTRGILEGIWSTFAIKNILSMSPNKAFIDPIIKIITKGKSKAKMVSFLNDGTFLFTYDVKTTIPSQFPNLKCFHVNNL